MDINYYYGWQLSWILLKLKCVLSHRHTCFSFPHTKYNPWFKYFMSCVTYRLCCHFASNVYSWVFRGYCSSYVCPSLYFQFTYYKSRVRCNPRDGFNVAAAKICSLLCMWLLRSKVTHFSWVSVVKVCPYAYKRQCHDLPRCDAL